MAPKNNQKSRFAGISAARQQRASTYFAPGFHGIVRTNRFEEGSDARKALLLAYTGTVVHTFADSARDSNTVGQEVTEIVKQTNVAFEGRVKAMLSALGDLTEANWADQEYDGQIVEEAIGEDQPLAGVLVEVRAKSVLKKAAQSKPEPTAEDFYTQVAFVRRLSYSQAKAIMEAEGVSEQQIGLRLPNLAEAIAEEAQG